MIDLRYGELFVCGLVVAFLVLSCVDRWITPLDWWHRIAGPSWALVALVGGILMGSRKRSPEQPDNGKESATILPASADPVVVANVDRVADAADKVDAIVDRVDTPEPGTISERGERF